MDCTASIIPHKPDQFPAGCGYIFSGGEISRLNARVRATRLKWKLAVQGYANDVEIKNCPKYGRTPVITFRLALPLNTLPPASRWLCDFHF
jgi:hypothetical protein